MGYKVEEVTTNKKDYLDFLLLADEQENMIDKYLAGGRMFRLLDNGVKCVAVVLELNDTACELKNIATAPQDQGKGYGRAMVSWLLQKFLCRYQTMYVGTGDVPKALGFYESCGFRPSHRVKNFFADHYDHPIVEDGILLRDMVYLRADRERGRTMDRTDREAAIRAYFNMWVQRDFASLDDIFAQDIHYSECYGPEYCSLREINLWIQAMLEKQTVLEWTINRFIHEENTAVVEWFFRELQNDVEHSFDGVSIIEFREDGAINSIKEFGSKAQHVTPYRL